MTITTLDNPRVMETASGGVFDLREPCPSQVSITDIAHHLSQLGRYCGAAKTFLSVAQHSVLVAREVFRKTGSHNLRKIAILHDAHEAYIGDWTRPLCEAYPELKAIRKTIISKVDAAIGAAFNINPADFALVKDADNAILLAEAYARMPSRGEGWGSVGWDIHNAERVGIDIHVMMPPDAKRFFLEEWRNIKGCLGEDNVSAA